MIRKLLRAQWLEFRRSPTFKQGLGINILLGFLGVYMLINALVVGFAASFIIAEYYPEQDIIHKFGGLFASYLAIDLVVRYLIQKFPVISITKYLTLNIKKLSLIRYLLVRSIFNFYNLLPLFVIIPFFFIQVLPDMTAAGSIMWLLTMLCLIYLNHFISFWLYIKSFKQPVVTYIIIAVLLVLILAEYKGWLSISGFLSDVMVNIYSTALVSIPFLVLTAIISIVYRVLRDSTYLEDHQKSNAKFASATIGLPFLTKGSKVSQLIQLEINMIWRNKRAKLFLIMSLALVPYVLLWLEDIKESIFFLIISSLFMTGSFMLNYGQLIFSWNSQHFNLLMTHKIELEDYILAKYYLLAASCIILYFISLPLAFIDSLILWSNSCIVFYCVGVVTFIYIWLGIYFSKRIDANASGFFNYEGFSIAHFIVMIPIIVIPILIHLPFSLLGYDHFGLVILAAIGIAGILCHKLLVRQVVKALQKKKYKLVNAFSSTT